MRVIIFLAVLAATVSVGHSNPADSLSRLSGMHERENRAQLRRMLGVDPARTPWCGAAAAWAVKRAGRKPPTEPMHARSWRKYGRAVAISNARRGDVVLLRNRRGHHVSIVTHMAQGKICAIGGNQSNRVQESCYSMRNVVAVRR